MKKLLQIIRCLGWHWFLFRLKYAFKQRSGSLRRSMPVGKWGQSLSKPLTGHFFNDFGAYQGDENTVSEADKLLEGGLTYFFHHKIQSTFPPNWFENSFTKAKTAPDLRHWSLIDDFGAGDIKGVWEQNRFAFVYTLINAYWFSKDEKYAEAFWIAVEDWRTHNPPNCGVNWKCGQEVAIRMFALVSGYFAFENLACSSAQRKKALVEMIQASTVRIDKNIDYALSQKNNHGISEAVGLWTGGLLLNDTHWIEKGGKLLETLACELIYEDGSFSQHSVNYHRVMIHDYLWAIQLGKANGANLSNDLLEKVAKSGDWLQAMLIEESGRLPNLGSNDGAIVLPITSCDYLDFRPTIQALSVIVAGEKLFAQGRWDLLSDFLSPNSNSVAMPHNRGEKVYRDFENGGYFVYRKENVLCTMRVPKYFTHRPAQCDILHVDLWYRGINILPDAGSFTYNSDNTELQHYFKSVMAHNTIQFDGHEQMPKLSRFLYGSWPKGTRQNLSESQQKYLYEYMDWKGCSHRRTLELNDKSINVIDQIGGFEKKAVLRWRLSSEIEWQLTENGCDSEEVSIEVVSSVPLKMSFEKGWQSLYYQEKTPITILEIECFTECKQITSVIRFK